MSIQAINSSNSFPSREGPEAAKNPRVEALSAFAKHAGGAVAVLLKQMLPNDIQSWQINEKNEFRITFNKENKGDLYGVDFAVAKELSGRIDPATKDVHFNEKGITGTYVIEGSLLQMRANVVNEVAESIIVTGGRTILFGKKITKSFEVDFNEMSQMMSELNWKT